MTEGNGPGKGQPLVDARGLTKRYGALVAAQGVSLRAYAGEIVGIVGPNGAGKTTTMEMMEGLRRPDEGSCTVCGFDTVREHRAVRGLIGIGLQQAVLPKEVKAGELLRLYETVYADPEPVDRLLRRFRLVEKARAMIGGLSGGQRQRLLLALAMVGRPRVIFLDEPTTGLDPKARRDLWDVVVGLRAAGRAVVLSTHYMEEVERLCDRVVVMDSGRVVAEGAPEELIAAYGPGSVIDVAGEGTDFDEKALRVLPGVVRVHVDGQRLRLHTEDAAGTLTAFAAYAQHDGVRLRDLRTRSATMDDAFLALTGRSESP